MYVYAYMCACVFVCMLVLYSCIHIEFILSSMIFVPHNSRGYMQPVAVYDNLPLAH